MNSGETKKIAVVVTTFNRKNLILKTIESLKSQTYPLFRLTIVDGCSTDGTRDLLRSVDGINVILMAENIGATESFILGMKDAIAAGAEYIWIMDDDARPEPDCLAELMKVAAERPNHSFYAPKVFRADPYEAEFYHHVRRWDMNTTFPTSLRTQSDITEIETVETSCFVGPLFPLKSIETVGLPDGRYFIWWDDVEYTYRLSHRIGPGCIVPGAKMMHYDRPLSFFDANKKSKYNILNSARFFGRYVSLPGRLFLSARLVALFFRYAWKSNDRLGLLGAVRDGLLITWMGDKPNPYEIGPGGVGLLTSKAVGD